MDYAKPADVVASMIDASLKKLALCPARPADSRRDFRRAAGRRHQPCFRSRGDDRPAAGRRHHVPGRLRHDRAARTRACHRKLRAAAAGAAGRQGELERGRRQTGRGCFSEICSAASSMAACWRSPSPTWEPSRRLASRRASSRSRKQRRSPTRRSVLAGMVSVFVKAILCNWLVCIGVVMAMTSTSTVGKIVAAWLPIFMFFAPGIRARRRQHVRHSDRHADGRQGQRLSVVGVEPDSGHARQSRRRRSVHGARSLRDLQAGRASRRLR